VESIDKMRLAERIRKIKLCGLSPFFSGELFKKVTINMLIFEFHPKGGEFRGLKPVRPRIPIKNIYSILMGNGQPDVLKTG
jgi:hypothetical protein